MAEQVTSKMLEIYESSSGLWKSYPIFQGRSAYESYLKLTTDNPKKTEAEWLVSLQGKDGIIGVDGKSAYQSYLDSTTDNPKKTESEWIASLQGVQGPKGDPGIIDYTEGDVIPEGTKVRLVDRSVPFKIGSSQIVDGSITKIKLASEVSNMFIKIYEKAESISVETTGYNSITITHPAELIDKQILAIIPRLLWMSIGGNATLFGVSSIEDTLLRYYTNTICDMGYSITYIYI